jgi:predicted secreted hydrolase
MLRIVVGIWLPVIVLAVLPAGGDADTRDLFKAITGPCHLRFPEDHGPHCDYRTEWWYYTGNVESSGGRSYAYQLTIFRYQTSPTGETAQWPDPASAWRTNQFYVLHAAVSDIQGNVHLQAEAAARGALALAGAQYRQERTTIFVKSASIEIGPSGHKLQAVAPDFSFSLELEPLKPPVRHGREGYTRKGTAPKNASCYYSFTRMLTNGTLSIDGKKMAVTGLSWMDHEFSTAPLQSDLVGWDWFSLQFDNHSELMLYFLRYADGRYHPVSAGTLVDPLGNAVSLTYADVQIKALQTWYSPYSKAAYPSAWQLSVPKLGMQINIHAQMANQEMRTYRTTGVIYWEGSVTVQGQSNGQAVKGKGYVELTGYAAPFRAPL